MYLIEPGAELTTDRIGKILLQFQTRDLPQLMKMWNYYQGKQAITRKTASDVGKPNNVVLTNYCDNIVSTYEGYLAGIPIRYSNDDADIAQIIDVLNYNDVASEDTEFLRQALIFGRAFEVVYTDMNANQRFRTFDARECVPIYDNTLDNNLEYVVRFWREDIVEQSTEQYFVEVYGKATVRRYHASAGFTSFEFVGETPHFYGQVPITVFSLNKDEQSIFAKIITLQDAYNELMSSEVDDFEAFCDSYLVLKGMIADDEQLASMKQHRVLMLDGDSDASYLTKNISDTQIQNMLQNVNDNIHKIANSPDFNNDKFMAQSGIAMRYKLIGFENNASGIEAQMRKALQRRIELLSAIISLTNGEMVWRDIDITFTRNLPENLLDIAQTINQFRGLVSDATLLAQIPFVRDVDKELELINAQKEANMMRYGFGDNSTTDAEKDEEKTDEVLE